MFICFFLSDEGADSRPTPERPKRTRSRSGDGSDATKTRSSDGSDATKTKSENLAEKKKAKVAEDGLSIFLV